MSDNLDRIERLIESNAKAILALATQGVELNAKIERTNAIVVELANVVHAASNRQEDH